jgi:hypothetical protein
VDFTAYHFGSTPTTFVALIKIKDIEAFRLRQGDERGILSPKVHTVWDTDKTLAISQLWAKWHAVGFKAQDRTRSLVPVDVHPCAAPGLCSPQPRVLLGREPQVDPAPARIDRMLQDLPRLRGSPGFPAPRQLPDLLRVSERQLPGQRGLQVRFRELNLPAAPQKKVHVDLVRGAVVARHGGSIGE